ncbi:MAG: pyruvate kinase [Clostridia bacterium]|nr:pyruvate kinase [Clostridia bacterium]
MRRKTKIVCTLGPSSESYEVLKDMVLAGMSVARFNMAHGSYEEHQKRIDVVKKVRNDLQKPVAIMIDIKGPEIRTGKVPKVLEVKAKDSVILTSRDVEAYDNVIPLTYKNIHIDAKVGGQVLLNDGLLELRIDAISGQDLYCTSLNNGKIGDHKNVHFPGIHLNIPFIREKDINDMKFAIKNQVEYIAASFVSRAEEVMQVRRFLDSNGGENINIISKIENKEGVDNVTSILNNCDGIMVARGDLGVEIPIEQIPTIQKKLIKEAHICGKKVITATEMLESMTYNPRPTRAEVSDVSNAVYDGTSAVMLSGESAVGSFPVQVVRTMASICLDTEKNISYKQRFKRLNVDINNISDAVSHSSVSAAHDLNAKCIVVCTQSGSTARMVSRYLPETPILAITTQEFVFHQLALSWGIEPTMSRIFDSSEEMAENARVTTIAQGMAGIGDTIVITSGITKKLDGTNQMRIEILK